MGISHWDTEGNWEGGKVKVENEGKRKKIIQMKKTQGAFALVESLAECWVPSRTLHLGSGKGTDLGSLSLF